MSPKQQQTDSASKLSVIDQVERLSAHFKSPQDEGQIKIFVDALQNCTVYQIETAFERCLNECEFMPKLVNVRERMPEQRYPPENPGRFTQQEPILDITRRIAREICKRMTGREYDDLDTIRDRQLITEVFTEAARERYRRMGINPDDWQRRARKASA
jgi:hypothetical protein